MKREIDDQALATILAALRYYQSAGQGNPSRRSLEIHEIATNSDEVISLDEDGIDALCEELNCGEAIDGQPLLGEILTRLGTEPMQDDELARKIRVVLGLAEGETPAAVPTPQLINASLLSALELANSMLERYESGEKPYQTDDEIGRAHG